MNYVRKTDLEQIGKSTPKVQTKAAAFRTTTAFLLYFQPLLYPFSRYFHKNLLQKCDGYNAGSINEELRALKSIYTNKIGC